MECGKERNLKDCGCTYPSCPRKGICCECIAHHRKKRELPGCVFPPAAEKTHNRSIEYFVSLYK